MQRKNIIKNAIIASIMSLAAIGGLSFAYLQASPYKNVEAAVGSYTRNKATYYTSAFSHKVTSSSYGTALLNTLHELMYDSHETYTSYDDLWNITKYTDYDVDNPNNIILLYSRQSVDGTPTASTWNREHVWCKSLSGGLYTSVSASTTNAGTDIHHLRPASTIFNSTRGNTPYGAVSGGTRLGDTDCYYTSNAFEPADYIKGDCARILMYMYTHYSSEISGTSTKSGALSITNIVYTSSGTKQAAWDLLMDWNESDPVDYNEMVRNDKSCYYTGNYNPFIDHPEYARMIWDDESSMQAGICFPSSSLSVSVGSTVSNAASAYGCVSSSGTIEYTSDNKDVATVSATGAITGVSNGVARIKARATINGVSRISYCFVTVGSGYAPKYTLNAEGIVYTPTSASTAIATEQIGSETVSFSNTDTTSKYHTRLTSGKTATMTITNFPKTIKSIKLYMSSNASKGAGSITVTVGGSSYYSKSGSFASIYGSYSQSFVPVDVTNSSASKKTGTIVITISSTENSLYFGKAVVDYTERAIVTSTAITVSPSTLSLTPGEDASLNAKFTPQNTTLQTVTWSSNNTNVASVTSTGLIRAISVGTATITATAKDKQTTKGTATIIVSQTVSGDDSTQDPAVISVSISPSSITLNLAGVKTSTLTASVTVINGANESVTWSSNNNSVATIASNGVVTGVSAGTATITATSTFDSTKKGICNVTVVNGDTISLDKNTLSLAVGQSSTITANASGSVSWATNNSTIATVNNGVVTGVAAGTATITATCGSASATCTVTVTASSESSGTSNYVKINSLDDVLDGYEYIIAAKVDNAYYAMPNVFSGDYISSSTAISVSSNDVITAANGSNYAVKFGVNGTTITISNGTKYLSYGSSSTKLSSATSVVEKAQWTISLVNTNGTFQIVNNNANTRGLIYRSGQYTRFAAYSLSGINGSDYFNLELFRAFTPNDYSTYFLNTVSCDNGVNAPSTANWTLASDKFNLLSAVDQNTLKTVTSNESGSVVEQTAARYDYIIGKYGTSKYVNFMNRTIVSHSNNLGNQVISHNAMLFLVVAATLGTFTFAAWFIHKKKQYDL